MIKIFIENLMQKMRKLFHLKKSRSLNSTCRLHTGVSLSDSVLGEYVVLFKNVFVYKSKVGAHTYIQENSAIYNAEIGVYCSIAANVVVGLVGHPTHLVSTHPAFYDITQPLPYFFVNNVTFESPKENTEIGPDVWIGHGAFIKSGIKIGVGSIVAAGAVVTTDVPSYSIVGGVPAKVIKKRFEDQLCLDLENSKWRELPKEQLKKLAPLVNEPNKFLSELKKVGV